MRHPRTLVAVLAVMSLALVPAAAAQDKGKSRTHPPSTKAHGPSPNKAAGAAGKKTGPTHTNPSSASGKKSRGTTTPPVVTHSSTTIDFTNTSLGQKLARNGAIRSKLETKLAALGYRGTVYQAAYGFRNQGQLMAATNAAQNQGFSFEQLKVLMTGYTVAHDGTVRRANLNSDGTISFVDPSLATNPAPTKSLGQAKQTLEGHTTTHTTTEGNTPTHTSTHATTAGEDR